MIAEKGPSLYGEGKRIMNRRQLEEEIKTLEEKIEEMKASKPSHDFTGTYGMRLFELEEELDVKRKALENSKGQIEENPL